MTSPSSYTIVCDTLRNMSHDKPKVIAIVGPTASGKTTLSIEIAKAYNGEVVSADSRQVYRGLDIGTGKVTTQEMEGVPHHLLDVADLTTTYTVTDFVRDATAAVTNIHHRSHLPVIAGGTFFYLDVLRGKQTPAPVPPNPQLRARLELLPPAELFAQLQAVAPDRAATIDPHNPRRLVRALEIHEALGSIPPPPPTTPISPYDWLVIGLEVPSTELRSNFRARANEWLAAGLLDEVKTLQQTISPTRIQECGFEYQLAAALLAEQIDRDEFITQFEQKNWQYAKRQLTWLLRDHTIEWYSPQNRECILERVKKFLGM